jgi:hypothetical protein
MVTAAILLSHLPTQISACDAPIKKLFEVINFLKFKKVKIITSAGQIHWNCIFSLALKNNILLEIVMPKKDGGKEWIKEQFNFLPENFMEVNSRKERDKSICRNADIVYPIWIRKDGHFEKILREISANRINNNFNCSSYKFLSSLKYNVGEISNEVKEVQDDFLWHWTRSRYCAWQGETALEFCQKLLFSTAPIHSGLDTLKRIIVENKICSSSLNIGNKIPVVCFTQNCPRDMIALFSYQPEKHRMKFEPYGIGVKKEFASAKGVEPIKYGGKADWNTMSNFENWKEEKEWRGKGDFTFDKECLENSIVVVRNKNEVDSIKKIFNGKVIPFEK